MKHIAMLLAIMVLLLPISGRAAQVDEATPVPYTGTPVVSTDGIELLYYSFIKGPRDDVTRFYGEFRNTTTVTILQPTITITLYDENEKLVETGEAVYLAYIDIIAGGATMPIVMNVDVELGSWAREQITIQNIREASSPDLELIAQGMELKDVNVTEKDEDSIRLIGTFHNTGQKDAQDGRIYVVIYDSAGKWTGYDGFARFDSPISPSESVPFEIKVDRIDVEGGWTYRFFWGASSY